MANLAILSTFLCLKSVHHCFVLDPELGVWSAFLLTLLCLSLTACVSLLSAAFNSQVFLSASSIAWAITHAFLKVNCLQPTTSFVLSLGRVQVTSWSWRASFKNIPISQHVAKCFKVTMYSGTLYSSCCILYWNLNCSAITSGFGFRCTHTCSVFIKPLNHFVLQWIWGYQVTEQFIRFCSNRRWKSSYFVGLGNISSNEHALDVTIEIFCSNLQFHQMTNSSICSHSHHKCDILWVCFVPPRHWEKCHVSAMVPILI